MTTLKEILDHEYENDDGHIMLDEVFVPQNVVTNHLNVMRSEIKKLQSQIEIQKEMIENLRKSNEFYANRRNWRKQTQTTNGLIRAEDQWDGKFKVGGKLARECQVKDQELQKKMEEV